MQNKDVRGGKRKKCRPSTEQQQWLWSQRGKFGFYPSPKGEKRTAFRSVGATAIQGKHNREQARPMNTTAHNRSHLGVYKVQHSNSAPEWRMENTLQHGNVSRFVFCPGTGEMQGGNISERSLHTSARGWAGRWEQTEIDRKERKQKCPVSSRKGGRGARQAWMAAKHESKRRRRSTKGQLQGGKQDWCWWEKVDLGRKKTHTSGQDTCGR